MNVFSLSIRSGTIPYKLLCLSFDWLDGRSVCHNILKTDKLHFQCSHRSTCLSQKTSAPRPLFSGYYAKRSTVTYRSTSFKKRGVIFPPTALASVRPVSMSVGWLVGHIFLKRAGSYYSKLLSDHLFIKDRIIYYVIRMSLLALFWIKVHLQRFEIIMSII